MNEDTDRILDAAEGMLVYAMVGAAMLFGGFILFCGLMWIGSSVLDLVGIGSGPTGGCNIDDC